jgi:acetyl-CoA carboxylase, biotin carboxylase subunit
VGPASSAIALMGDKVRAREVARDAGVPTIPGSDGALDADAAATLADEVSYPVMLKAAGGGGGRGIRIVHDEHELRSGFKVAAAEASGAFGDDRLYLEKLITPARHVEVQVLGDGERCVHLFERECSLQRRRQKVVEETPSPGIGPETRDGLCRSALALCEAIGYRSAGTLEFLVDAESGDFFFIEMNTRIQVEHPVTELVTGVDLIAAQLTGELPDFERRGHALELRLTAEDPDKKFLPSPGTVTEVVWPAGPWVRVDTWLEPGVEVPPFYDSLLAKLIVWGASREQCVARARRALREVRVEGIKTTAPLLARLLDEDWFARGDFHTTTLEEWLA